jgi:hypothetical protein
MGKVNPEELEQNKKQLEALRMTYIKQKIKDYVNHKFTGRLSIEFSGGNIVRVYNNEMLVGATDIGIQLERM